MTCASFRLISSCPNFIASSSNLRRLASCFNTKVLGTCLETSFQRTIIRNVSCKKRQTSESAELVTTCAAVWLVSFQVNTSLLAINVLVWSGLQTPMFIRRHIEIPTKRHVTGMNPQMKAISKESDHEKGALARWCRLNTLQMPRFLR